ncbi:ribosome small subunit-dependent GTPase A [Thiohalomonas denitrificans]|uniref:Small ribosomal subunit biogenesis GTPase RsgA n=1 Tax=Thiohalomonas denitrificans TaxID=415747 RepID=A0A1G5QLC7_9GAMM|nr:ribosome small subunit-dependent GTPase A [Thiohalomonas denitrificans]SCZ62360.1 ribosome biogenesis GTPase [Thiohalomonas denitrificans]
MSIDFTALQPLGWSNAFSTQLSLEQMDSSRAARVTGVERGSYLVDAGSEPFAATLASRFRHTHTAPEDLPTVGDWVLLELESPLIVDRLKRRSLIARRMAGGTESQPIAANIDLMVIVSGLDGEFNLHRIERYLVIAAQAEVMPLVLLTKADCVDEPESFVAMVQSRMEDGEVLAVNTLSDPLSQRLAHFLAPGTTLVVVGSSGVGKSTLVNNLAGVSLQATRSIRKDSKGRHTTTSRTLIRLPGGACIIDVPGMREVGLAPVDGAVARQFRTIGELAEYCRFADCSHEDEPGCAVRQAVDRGEIDPDEWDHYLKLKAEERHNVADHQRRRRERVFGKMVREVMDIKRRTGRR